MASGRLATQHTELDQKIEIPNCINDFLMKHVEENFVSKLAEKNGVAVQHNGLVLLISGTSEKIKQFKRSFKDSYICDIITLDTQPGLIKDHVDELSRIADSCKCCIQTKFAKDKEPCLENVASWYYPCSPGKIALLLGHMEDLETDFRIVFVTDKLLPLHKTSREEHEKYRDSVTDPSKQTYGVGQSFEYKKEDECTTKAIVVSKSNSTQRETACITLETAKVCLQNILREAKGCNAKSIAVPVSLRDEKLTKLCMSAIFSVHKEWSEFEAFFFCQNNDVAKTAQRIDDTFWKNSPGYFRETHMENISLRKVSASNNISIQVEIGSLVDLKVDVLVNTVNLSLDLKKGSLSKQILKEAGDELQDFCTKNYPDGIEAGNIAVTQPGKLQKNGVKWIFHCALPPFKKSTFVKNIKSIVRKCLCEMSKRRVKTVAFPALGTGNLGYPIRDTAKAMFDAVEEHRRNAMNYSVKKVSFVLHQDDRDTCEVFCAEETRHKSKQSQKDKKQGFPKIFTDVGVGEGKVRLNVAKDSELGYFSSTVIVVDIKFIKGQRQKKLEMKPSSKKPKGWNDLLKVFCCNGEDTSSLAVAVANVLEFCTKNRISDILMPTYKEFVVTAVDQIKVISQEVREYVKDNIDICLQNVFISVPDSDSLDEIEKQLNSREGTTKDSSLDWCTWRLTINERLVDFKVVGKTLDSVKQAANMLQDYVYNLESRKNIMESTGAIPKSPEAISKRITAQELPLVSSEMQPQDQAVQISDTSDVSAEINPGIIQFLKQKNVLELWEEKMRDIYFLEFLQKESGVVVAKGSFDAIILFEQYLENGIINIASVSDQVFADYKKQAHMQPGNSETKQYALGAINDEQQKQVTEQTKGQGCMKKDNKELEHQQYSTREVTKKNYTAYTSKCTLSVNGLEIAVLEGNITVLPADCIVIYSKEKLEDERDGRGLLVHVPCQNNRQACPVCAKTGGLKLRDHRTKHGGNLPCKEVLHVLGQALNEEDLSNAVEMCLEEAARLNCSSLSIPVMISGAEDIPRQSLVMSYIQALGHFSKQKKSLFKVNIIDFDPTSVAHLTEAFTSIDTCSQAMKNKNENPSGSKIRPLHEIEYMGKTGTIRIFSILGKIEAVEVAAVVSTEDKSISGRSGIARILLKLGNECYKKEHAKLPKGGQNKVGSVFETKVMNDGQLTCQYVIHAIVPRRNREYCKDTSRFSDDVYLTVIRILEKATHLRCNSLAIPFIGTSEDERQFPTPIETCCKMMYKGITDYLQGNDTTLNRIEVVSPAEGVVQIFREQMCTNICVTI